MSFDWLQTWWQHYGEHKQLRIFIFRQGSRFSGIIPIYLEEVGIWPVRLRIARLVGANIPPKAFDPPVASESAAGVFLKFFSHLFAVENVELLAFGPVSETWSAQAGFRNASNSPCYRSLSSWRVSDVLTVFRLRPKFDEYIASLSKKERKARNEKLRLLQRTHKIKLEAVSGVAAGVNVFDEFCEQHAAQWSTKGKGGHFVDWPRSLEFHRALVRRAASRDHVLFVKLLADDHVVAIRYGYRIGNRVYTELPSRSTGPYWDRLGLGTTFFYMFIEKTIELGISTLYGGLGHYDYKVRLGGDEIPVGTWYVSGSSPVSRLKAYLFLPISRLVMFTTYNLWHRRILPKMPNFLSRSLSLFWLRFDV